MRIADTTEVAEFLKCHRNTVLKLAKNGTLPSFRLGSDLRFDLDAVERWAKAQMKQNQADALNQADLPKYCTQNRGDCETCSLRNYGRDCRNNPIRKK